MVSVASLLNPVPLVSEDYSQPISPCSEKYEHGSDSLPPPPFKKQKMSKDAAIFAKGKVQGEIRYPPCELQSEKVAAEHRKFQVYPIGQIAEYRRHIPYNSEKKSFLEKTGRESFEVFQYTFKLPGDERAYTVMWDYNVGLVRITPFFKCCQYAKTMPAKMLNNNPGLREICHSITGGALAAQGYWMPFNAAKAVAATFCYHIRYALTPVFGLDFVSLCVKPSEEGFGHMVIDRSIIRHCTEEAKEYRTMSREGSLIGSPATPVSATFARWSSKPMRLKPVKNIDVESGYGTDTDRSDKYLHSPQSSSQWTALSTPRSAPSQQYKPSPPKEIPAESSAIGGYEVPPSSLKCVDSRKSHIAKRNPINTDDDYDEISSSAESLGEALVPMSRKRQPKASMSQTRAAYLLMKLHIADASLVNGGCESKRRRASS